MSIKLKNGILILLLAGTATVALTHYNMLMMGLTTFVLAYLSKGTRRFTPPNSDATTNDD